MDNTVTLPGYKYYLDPDGTRPALAVAFLDIEPDPDAVVAGVCLPVDAAALAALDERERNYERVDVTGAIGPQAARVWAYTGRADSRERFAAALRAGTCVTSREYAERVPPTPGCPPVRDLRRVDL
jgi:gamma-glutamylcyclotransferase (GGCT)/AIG2-like uncharacterized protein YtfP